MMMGHPERIRIQDPNLFFFRQHTPMYGGKKYVQGQPYCPVWHELCHLFCLPAGEEPVRGLF
jgi:hypothetical protein